MKSFYSILFFAVTVGSFQLEARLQSVEFESLYIKWLPKKLSQPSRCFKTSDRVFRGKQTPQLAVDSKGLFYDLEIELDRLKKGCRILEIGPTGDEAAQSAEVRESSGGFDSLFLSVRARLPFEKLVLKDSDGRSSELLFEAKVRRLEDESFLDFFKMSRFMGKVLFLSSPVKEFPIVLLDYELPTFFSGRFLFQANLAQSLWSFSSNPYYFGKFELAGAWRFLGEGKPLDEKWNAKVRLIYEGFQVTEPSEQNVYPLTASRIAGIGLEASTQVSSLWSLWGRSSYLMGVTQAVNISKIKTDFSVSARFNSKWRFEIGSQWMRHSRTDVGSSVTDSINELGFYFGVRLAPLTIN